MRPGDITRALGTLTQAKIETRHGKEDGEFVVTMPTATVQHLAINGHDSGGHAGLIISREIGQRVHITGWQALPGRRADRAEVTVRVHKIARGEAFAGLVAAGYSPGDANTVLDTAEQFPSSWHYPPGRRRAVCFHMPYGRWEVVDSAASEARIAAAGHRRGGLG
jgi:hypothetical protein